jgi:c-di-GMP-specific phosphodiesterase
MELGKSLNLTVIAEGFELSEQIEFFKKINCDLFQGYYFARPMPIQDLLTKYPDPDSAT